MTHLIFGYGKCYAVHVYVVEFVVFERKFLSQAVWVHQATLKYPVKWKHPQIPMDPFYPPRYGVLESE